MEFRPMTAKERAQWYFGDFAEAFAENERKPLADIENLIAEGRYELLGLFGNEGLLGYAALWMRKGIPLVLLDYLGVTARRRNSGLGTEMLRLLKAQHRLIVVEAELPLPGDSDEANSLRLRRIGFYERNSFSSAYEMATCGLRWQALLNNTESYALPDIMAWHRALYGPCRTDVRIPIASEEVPETPYWMKSK